MKKLILILSAALLFASGCTTEHFISDSSFRRQVAADLSAKKAQLPEGDFFSILEDKSLDTYEKEALEFLYAYLSESDIVDKSGEYFLENVRLTRQAVKEMPWGKDLDESLIRYFVLPPRVNNEPLDDARKVFYPELKERISGLGMREAILAVNHWCHEKVVYTPSDARTSSPLQSVRTAYGRCGEESTFCVSALRSVGIPARQVYTPRWAHTDDNHAWVEAWVDGGWHFLGACEPEAVLDLGWFNTPASRGMLMHTKVFGNYNGAEEIMVRQQNYTEINVIDNYAKTARVDVTVVNSEGEPVPGANVEFKLYNYAEFYTVAKKVADNDGKTFLTSGLGNLLCWASDGEKFGYTKLSFGKEAEAVVELVHDAGEKIDIEYDMVPPPVHFTKPYVSEEQKAQNEILMAQEDSVRNAYVETMFDRSKALEWCKENGFEASVADFLEKSRGNHPSITGLLKDASDKKLAVSLLGSISAKDLRDASKDVLENHLETSVRKEGVSQEEFVNYVLCPRISWEQLCAYKPFFQEVLSDEQKSEWSENPSTLAQWIKENIRLDKEINKTSVPTSPVGVWKARVSDVISRNILFVAVCRSLGVPSRLNPMDRKVQYIKGNGWIDVDFENAVETVSGKGTLKLSYDETVSGQNNPRYYTHFTISKYNGGSLSLLDFEVGETDMGDGAGIDLFKKGVELDNGYYLLCTGTREPDGSVLTHLSFFAIETGKVTSLPLVLRASHAGQSVIGQICLPDGAVADAGGEGFMIGIVLGVGEEPTNHVLRDIAALKGEFEKWGRPIYMVFPTVEKQSQFRPQDFPGIPGNAKYIVDSNAFLQKAMAEGGQLGDPDQLPIVVLGNTKGEIYYAIQGYTIGIGEQLMKVIKNL